MLEVSNCLLKETIVFQQSWTNMQTWILNSIHKETSSLSELSSSKDVYITRVATYK